MIRIQGTIPDRVYVAVSGGPDSMAVLDFVNNGRRDVTAAYFHHGTHHGQEAHAFISKYCQSNNIRLVCEKINIESCATKSKEEHWRDERHLFLSKLGGPVITGHHLDDVTEWWLFSSLHGMGKLIPFSRDNIIRPFLTTKRSDLLRWVETKNIPYVSDPGNKDEKYMRSIVRNKILPQALRVNPGLRKVIFKKLAARGNEQ
jgi:tRNA(Ile)-lysidine synthase